MNPPSLELHYHLKGGSHAMDAFIRNKCEAEALAAFSYIAERLGLEVTIESVAHGEGGLKEIWKFISTKPEVASVYIALLTLFVNTAVTVWNAPPKGDKELDSIAKETAKATLEEKLLAVEKAKMELKKLQEAAAAAETPLQLPPSTPAPPAPALPALPNAKSTQSGMDYATHFKLTGYKAARVAQGDRLNPVVIEAISKAIAAVAEEPKFTTRRSNFFKTLLPYSKVTAFGLQFRSPYQDEPEYVIKKKDFLRYVLKTDKLPPVNIEEAVITIVAPVIDGSGMAWRGIYQDEPIGFFMKDNAFKGQVLHRQVSFKHGDAIRCSLVIERKLDETGEAVVTSRSVDVVIEKIDEGGVTETPQGKKRRFEDKNAQAQGDLDLGNS